MSRYVEATASSRDHLRLLGLRWFYVLQEQYIAGRQLWCVSTLKLWKNNLTLEKQSDLVDTDVFAFGGPVNFRGYFPNYSVNATIAHNYWSWALLKAHPRNRAGSVTLRSADPLDTPNILFNFFEDGAEDDLQAIYESILLARDAFARQPIPFTEVLPGSDVQTYITPFRSLT
jgi:hypothetical protein